MDARQDRREFKFLLSERLAELVIKDVAEHFDADQYVVAGYHIQSDYFDSEDYVSYWRKVLGYRGRERVRARIYRQEGGGQEPARFIEIKHKDSGLTAKLRMPITAGGLRRLLLGAMPAFEGSDGECFRKKLLSVIESPPWRPRVRIGYHREAYDSKKGGRLRVTFDANIKCCFPDYSAGADPEPGLDIINPGDQVMEVKTIGPVPYWFRSLLGKHAIQPCGFSKYTIALERFHFYRSPQLIAL